MRRVSTTIPLQARNMNILDGLNRHKFYHDSTVLLYCSIIIKKNDYRIQIISLRQGDNEF